MITCPDCVRDSHRGGGSKARREGVGGGREVSVRESISFPELPGVDRHGDDAALRAVAGWTEAPPKRDEVLAGRAALVVGARLVAAAIARRCNLRWSRPGNCLCREMLVLHAGRQAGRSSSDSSHANGAWRYDSGTACRDVAGLPLRPLLAWVLPRRADCGQPMNEDD